MINKFYVIGTGSHSKVIIDTALENKINITGVLDYNPHNHNEHLPNNILGIKVYPYGFEVKDSSYFIMGIGDQMPRYNVYNECINKGFKFSNLISNKASISTFSKLGNSVFINSGVRINANSHLGNNNIINTNSSIDHDVLIGNDCHIAPGVTVCGNVKIGNNVFIGAGSTIQNSITIGSNVIIGSHSNVNKNINDNSVNFGNPCKFIKNYD
jgi:sugar O-acyltransferase (sialic acid O-acetyltransferase NeuD family)